MLALFRVLLFKIESSAVHFFRFGLGEGNPMKVITTKE